MNEKRNSASIAGAGKISGGTYERLSISGAGKVTGDVVAEEIKISGIGKIEGRTEAKEISASGSAAFTDTVVVEELRISGSGRVEGRLEAKEFKCSGTCRVNGSVSSEYVKVSGHLHVGGDLESAIFNTSGGFHVEGLLSADKIEVRLGGRCQAREVGGETIDVRRGGWREKGLLLDGLMKIFSGGGVAGLHADQIEGDDIYLEDTIAEVVRGKRIEIGPGCHIGKVEYEESLKVHPTAEVDKQAKV
jgi:cytoskeletal protein CcmA (bactofilin family)